MSNRILTYACLFAFWLASASVFGQANLPKTFISPFSKANVTLDIASLQNGFRSGEVSLPISAFEKETFEVRDYDMLSDELQKAYPNIQTFKLIGKNRKDINGRMLVNGDYISVTFYQRGQVTSIWTKDGKYFLEKGVSPAAHNHPICSQVETLAFEKGKSNSSSRNAEITNGTQLRTYRLAIASTGEFFVNNGGDVTTVRNLIFSTVTSLNAIYENELAVSFNPLDPRIYLAPSQDVFTPDQNGGDLRTTQAGNAIDLNFDSNDYDIGHVFHASADDTDGWSSGGVAVRGSVCDSGQFNGEPIKAQGWSGSFNTLSNGWIRIAAHEFAHMFDATHTFNGTGESCTENIWDETSYEIGSGTTIMSYEGVCGDDQNIPAAGGERDNYFHVNSLAQMVAYLNDEATCGEIFNTNNTPPNATANPCNLQLTIPKSTPFRLTGEASDVNDDDVLTYLWEQFDEDGPGVPTQGLIGAAAAGNASAPILRSYPPSSNLERTFPRIATIANGLSSDPFEVLPSVARTLNFQFTVRDNNPGAGGINTDMLAVEVSNDGPLVVNTPGTIEAGSEFAVTWFTNNSDALCDNVNVLMSIDGGFTFTYPIATDVPYTDESVTAILPANFTSTTEARFMVECADNRECFTFFNMNGTDVSINSECDAQISYICDTDTESFANQDPALDLEESFVVGKSAVSLSVPLSSTSPVGQIAGFDPSAGNCVTISNYLVEPIRFSVTEDGLYTFGLGLLQTNPDRYGFISIHDQSYDRTSSCDSYLASSIEPRPNNQVSISPTLTVELEKCIEYVLVASNFVTPANNTLIESIDGPGDFVVLEDLETGYAYTFIAVDENGVIELVSNTANFVNLSGGEYAVYGITYRSAAPPVDPQDWTGSTLESVVNSDCVLQSFNQKDITVDSDCKILSIDPTAQTACNPLDNLFSQTFEITYEKGPTTGALVVNGTPFPISGSPQTVTLMGLEATGEFVDVSANFSELPNCRIFLQDLFQAPENCCPFNLELGEDRVLCDDEFLVLNAGDEGDFYQWFENGDLLPDTNQVLQITRSATYSVEVTNIDGCSKFDFVNITVESAPEVNIDLDTVSVCEGDPYLIVGQTNAPRIRWKRNGVIIPGDTTTSLLVTAPGTYAMRGESANCDSEDTIVVNFVTKPVVDLGEDTIRVCEGEMVELFAGNGGTSYVWRRDLTILPEMSATLEADLTGLYEVEVDNGGGCSTTDQVFVEFVPLPEVVAGPDRNFCQGDSVDLFTFVSADRFEWYFDNSLTTINITEPNVKEAGEYVLVGYNALGCSISDTVVVMEVMPPDVDLGEDLTACIGSEIPLSAGIEGGITLWLKDGVFFSSEPDVVITEPGTYLLSASNAASCSGTDTVQIEFIPGPTLDLSGQGNVCEGQSITLTATTDGTNIVWLQDGEVIVGESDFDLEVSDAGVFTAEVSGDSDCIVSDFIEVTVNPTPTFELPENSAICDGDDLMLTPEVEGETFTWTQNGNPFSMTKDVVITEEGVYELVVENEFGCSFSATTNVAIDENPAISVEEIYNGCEGSGVLVEVQGVADNYEWYINDELVAGENSSTLQVEENATIRIIGFSANGCSSEIQTATALNPAPSISLGEDFTLCPNEEVELTAGTFDSYLWSTSETSESIIAINSGLAQEETVMYQLTITDENGCTAEDTVEATLLPAVSATIEASNPGVCNGEPVTLTAAGGTVFEWSGPDSTFIEINEGQAVVAPSETTTYSVLVSDPSCPGNEGSASIEISILEAGEGITAGEDDCAVEGSEYTLQASGGVAYQWEDDGTFVSATNIANPTVLPTEETIYMVTITDENGCNFVDEVVICLTDDPLENFVEVNVITPNGDGANDALEFKGLEAFPENRLTILNRWGNVILDRSGYQQDDRLWDGTDGGEELPADTYYYILEFDGKVIKNTITIIR